MGELGLEPATRFLPFAEVLALDEEAWLVVPCTC